MIGDRVLDSQIMFRHACSFADCSYLCLDNLENEEGTHYIIPSIVNAAFACEVFLKALLHFSGMSMEKMKINGHTIDKLWDGLRKQDSHMITHIYSKIIKEYSVDMDQLEILIKDMTDVFTKCRYYYEINGVAVDLTFLYVFVDALKESCCEIINGTTWNEYISLEEESSVIDVEE